MKKILFLSLILLCTAMSAWSYTTGTVEIRNTEDDNGHCVDSRTGIVVTGPEKLETRTCWTIVGDYSVRIVIPFGYVITSVFVHGDASIIECDNLILNYNPEESYLYDWVQDGTFKYYKYIDFKAKSGESARIAAVRITYHEHDISLNDSWAETCVAAGKKASWTCSDCGHTYYDEDCTSEVEKEEDLILPIDPTKHVLVKRAAVGATDTEDGYTVDHWHCQACGKNFADEDCTEQITENVIIRAKSRDWLCFTANTDNSTVALKKNGEPYEAALEYTTTETMWEPYTFGQTITLTDAGDRVYFRNASDDLAKGFSKDFTFNYYQFAMTGSIAASGNVMSLLDKTCLATSFPYDDGNVDTPEDFNYFVNLFSGCESLTSAPELPAIKLTPYCYMWMFKDCTGLTQAPELPAMALSDWCYGGMFDGCTGLKQAPALPANTMQANCYASMFRGCTGLTEAPELLAMTLAGGCYSQMFSGCTKLNHVKVAFTEWPNDATNNWLKDVASTGTFVCPDALDKSQTGVSYIPEGWTPVFEVKANNEPETENYYSTFYSGTNAYKVPNGVTAYTGVVEEDASNPDASVLKLIAIEGGVIPIIPADEAVILKATQSQIYLPYTTETGTKSTDNQLSGTDEAMTLGANDYALSLGQNGVGFYLWDGKPIGANKAYLKLGSVGVKALIFQFEDGETTGILKPVMDEKKDSPAYNLNGVRVNDNHKGIVIKNGKKYVVK